ncbi:MAG: hypothetical protein JWP98_849 [Edaphobacter sp.]|nr:hypothetical protein [Edaphobacter sp.]
MVYFNYRNPRLTHANCLIDAAFCELRAPTLPGFSSALQELHGNDSNPYRY